MTDQTASRASHVFISGVSRSGTTLLRKTLNTSDEVAIAHENHFLGHLVGRDGVRHQLRRFRDRSDDATVRALVDHLYDDLPRASKVRGASRQWRWLAEKVDREVLATAILATDRSDRAIFAAVMDAYADFYGKPVRGEKTPAHLRHVPQLLEWFPGGRVIQMIRDPRAIYVSEVRRRSKESGGAAYRLLRIVPPLLRLALLLQVTVTWLEAAWRNRLYTRRYPGRYLLVRFEDLVTAPEPTLRTVCAFLAIAYDPLLLDQVVVSRGFTAGQAGFDREAADRWRRQIGRVPRAWLGLACRPFLRGIGYG